MNNMSKNNIALSMNQVSRIYPRDISNIPFAIIKEMLFSKSRLGQVDNNSFFALREISLNLRKGQKLAVLGTHRSGKSTLASLAAGVLSPTSGNIDLNSSSVTLLRKPSAGFRPNLTLLENLKIRGTLAGFHDDMLMELIQNTLSLCDMNLKSANSLSGNFSPHIIKQVAMTLLLEFSTEIYIIDSLTSAGIGAEKLKTREYLRKKIESSTSLVISSDFTFIQQVCEQAILLHQGRYYGPFEINQAIEHFKYLPEYDANLDKRYYQYDPLKPPTISDVGKKNQGSSWNEYSTAEMDEEEYEIMAEQKLKDDLKQKWSPIVQVKDISVDGNLYSLSQLSLIRSTGDKLLIKLILFFSKNTSLSHFKLCLHPESGEEFGCSNLIPDDGDFIAQQKYSLIFDLEIPDIPVNSYGLSITPVEVNCSPNVKNRQKVLKFGLLGEKVSDSNLSMNVSKGIVKKIGSSSFGVD